MNEHLKILEEAYGLIKQANYKMIHAWFEYTLFTWRWWLEVSMTVIPWVLWFILRRKGSKDRLLYAGFFSILISSWFDVMGILFGLWSYYFNIVPFSPAFIPWDFTLIPVFIMFFIQVKPKFSPVVKSIIFSLFSSFIAQPIFVLIGYYNPKDWHHYYSFPIFIVIYLIAHWFSKKPGFQELE